MQYEVVKRVVGLVTMLGLAITATFLLAGCVDDLYADCPLDPQSADPAVKNCARNDGSFRGCIVENQTACQTSICGRYQGSTPFCTKSCSSDSECPDGRCLEFVFQSGRKYCVLDSVVAN